MPAVSCTRILAGHARTKPAPFSAENARSYHGGVSHLLMFDDSLGKGAVTAGPDGGLRLNPLMLNHQLHEQHWDKLIGCPCRRCKQARKRNPRPAPAPVAQPWEIRKAA